jgi:predicted oxidoreductase
MTQQNKTVTPTKHSGMIYGTWRMLDDKPSAQTINKRLHRCVELGISSVDSAEIYGRYNTEKLLGQAIALSPSLRDQLQIISKAGIYIPCPEQTSVSIAHYNATAARLIESVDRSLQLLGTQALDVFLVHRPDWLSAVDETASGLNKLIRDGKIRSAGVSNYSASQFSALNSRMEQALVSNQVDLYSRWLGARWLAASSLIKTMPRLNALQAPPHK